VRVASPMAGSEAATAKVVLKPMDATANPYLALAATLAAGMDGMERGLDPGEPVLVDPATLSEEERTSRGIRPLPNSLEEALDELERNETLTEALGEPLVRTHLAVGRGQVEVAKPLSPEQIAEATRGIY
jgi:glutamine synthetase